MVHFLAPSDVGFSHDRSFSFSRLKMKIFPGNENSWSIHFFEPALKNSPWSGTIPRGFLSLQEHISQGEAIPHRFIYWYVFVIWKHTLSFGEASTSSTCSMAPSMSITAGAGRDASFATCHWQSGVGGWQVEMSKWKKICLLNLRSLLNLWRFIQNYSVFRYLSCTPLKMDAWKIIWCVRVVYQVVFFPQFSGVQNWGPSFWERTLRKQTRIIWGLGRGKRCGVQDRCHGSWNFQNQSHLPMFYCQCWKTLPLRHHSRASFGPILLQDWHNSFITPVEDSGDHGENFSWSQWSVHEFPYKTQKVGDFCLQI